MNTLYPGCKDPSPTKKGCANYPLLHRKAVEGLGRTGAVTSQSGLTRQELRALERKGIVTKSYSKHEKTGVIECFWKLTVAFLPKGA